MTSGHDIHNERTQHYKKRVASCVYWQRKLLTFKELFEQFHVKTPNIDTAPVEMRLADVIEDLKVNKQPSVHYCLLLLLCIFPLLLACHSSFLFCVLYFSCIYVCVVNYIFSYVIQNYLDPLESSLAKNIAFKKEQVSLINEAVERMYVLRFVADQRLQPEQKS